MNKKITISKNQAIVLKFFQENDNDYSYFFKYISEETGLELRLVRIACRALRAKGLLNYGVCVDCDCRPSGSGYSLTLEGIYFNND